MYTKTLRKLVLTMRRIAGHCSGGDLAGHCY